MGTSPSTYGEDEHFKLRVCAIAVNDDKILIHRAEQDDFWALPGGHVEIDGNRLISLLKER